MAEQKIILRPGIDSLATPTLNSAGWSACNLVRWQGYQGGIYLQTIGGWMAFNPAPLVGTGRTMHAFGDLSGNNYLVAGTNERLQLYWSGNQYDITPYVRTVSLTNKFSTTSGDATVTVTDTAHGAFVGDWVLLEIYLGVGGIVLFGYYQITTVPDANHYTFEAADLAQSTVTLGGDTPTFTTTPASSVVTVGLVNHGYSPASVFTVQVATAVGGITVAAGRYQVATVPTADTFTIDVGVAAASGATASENGDAEIVDYLLPSGPVQNIALTGWGAGGWGTGTWGSSNASEVINPARIWSLDNFGELLLANPTNLGLYVWTPPPSVTNVAESVATAPSKMIGMFVAMPQAQVIGYGCEVLGVQDPLLIRWSDTGDYTDWVATSTNQAGSYRLSRGSKIVGGLQAAQTALIWSDVDLWSMVYQGPPFIYSINTISQECGLIGQLAATVLGSNVYWMSDKGFFVLSNGTVSPIPCPVWDQIFANLNTTNQNLCVAAANTPFNEVFFFYPSLDGAGDIDSYVKVNVQGGLWDFGQLVRTGWIDQSLFGMPLGIDADGLIQQHEMGYSNNGVPMVDQYAQTGDVDIAEGQDFPFVDQLIPDIRFYDADAALSMTIYGRDYPLSDAVTYGPFNWTTSSKFTTTRLRKRQVAFRFDFSGDQFVRIGAVRYRIASAGRSVGAAA